MKGFKIFAPLFDMFNFVDKISIGSKIKKVLLALRFPLVMAAISYGICLPVLYFMAGGTEKAMICSGFIAGMIFIISLSEQNSISKREF